MKTIRERFEQYVMPAIDGCHYWLGATGSGRHHKRARFHLNGENQVAARVSYELYKGKILEGLCVCHSCDNEACVNPDHLFIGTQAENMLDMYRKGRENIRMNAKLSFEKAEEIRLSNDDSREIAKRYKIDRGTVYKIKRNELWLPKQRYRSSPPYS